MEIAADAADEVDVQVSQFHFFVHQPRRHGGSRRTAGNRHERPGALGLVDGVDPGPVAPDLAGDLVDLQRLQFKMLP